MRAYDHGAPGQRKAISWGQRAAVRMVTVIALSRLRFATFRRRIAMRRGDTGRPADRSGNDAMTFFDWAALSFLPVLAALIAAALILPRALLALYAGFVIAAVAVYADLSGRYDNSVLNGMLAILAGLLTLAALAAGLATRWALKARPPE